MILLLLIGRTVPKPVFSPGKFSPGRYLSPGPACEYSIVLLATLIIQQKESQVNALHYLSENESDPVTNLCYNRKRMKDKVRKRI